MAYEDEKKLLAAQLRDVGQRVGLESMNAIIKKSMLEYSQIGKLHKGEGNPTFETFLKIAKALDVPLKDLFDFDEKATPKETTTKKTQN